MDSAAAGRTRRVALWFVIGVVAAIFLQWIQIRAIGGGLDGLLSVGQTSPMRPYIETDLGSVITVPDRGHDGQTAYLIARDPLAAGPAAAAMDHAGFRYRRILYPGLAGLGGLLGAGATLVGLAAVAALAFGLAAAATADLAIGQRANDRLALAAVINPGLWLSVQLLTVDALAIGLTLTGLALWRREKLTPAAIILALATLAKDQMLLVALSLAAWELTRSRRTRAAIIGGPAVVTLLGWSLVTSLLVDDGFAVRGNLTAPFAGIAAAARNWDAVAASDLILAVGTLALIGLAAAGAWRRRREVEAFLLVPWIALALISSNWVWDLGNNVARVYAIVLPLAALALARRGTRARLDPAPA